MPLKRIKDGNVVEEYGTKQPTPEQAQENKQKRIAEQNKSREKFEKGREKPKSETVLPVSQLDKINSGNKSKAVDK